MSVWEAVALTHLVGYGVLGGLPRLVQVPDTQTIPTLSSSIENKSLTSPSRSPQKLPSDTSYTAMSHVW